MNVTGDTITGDVTFNSGANIHRGTHSSGFLVGSYNNVGANSGRTNPIYTIGSNYQPTDTDLVNMYGIGYTHSDAAFDGINSVLSGWGMYVAAGGNARIGLDAQNGTIKSTGVHYVDTNQRVFADNYHPNADKWTTTRTLSLSGDASGSVSWDGSGNATLSVTVADDSHNHTIANVDGLQTALNGKLSTSGKAADSNLLDGIDSSSFLRKGVGYEWTATGSNALSFRSADTLETSTSDQASLEVYQDTSGADAFMSFHVNGDYAAYFGLKGDINDFAVGGWSMGNNYYRVWHQGNDGSGSGLDADLLDGLQLTSQSRNNQANRVVRTQGNGYAEFGWINTTSGNTTSTLSDIYVNTNDGYIRKATLAHVASQLPIDAGAKNDIFWENGQTVTSNYTITNGKNAMSAGPITINSGVTVTVGAGETWTVI